MVLISVNVDAETYEFKQKKALNWRGLILEGIESSKTKAEMYAFKDRCEQLEKDFQKLDAEQKLRGKKLAAYIEKYGIDEEILYKIKE